MYYYYPFEEKAYSYKNQYFLGSEMLVCPVTTKIDEHSQKSGEECFIPAGIWTDIFTGEYRLLRNVAVMILLIRKKLMWLYVQVHQIHLLCTKILEMDLTTKKANML